ncbi:DUF4157 domain-containing protein [Nostoc spongiaeforme FACHB-130]|uniref:DUF4157 domain-containing protein n=2 Tax=Nostoc TaxID=1177 RepID=A0ABR8FRL9_9NOSO|nr:DUF4157 domain-containing protein [Nostoc spongiaeforme FACHB-130]
MKLGNGEANENYQPQYQPDTSTSRLQMKLTIGQPGDKYEQEADRIAKDVVQSIHSTDNQVVQNKEQPTESIGQGQNFWLSRMSIQQPPYQPDTTTPRLQMKLSIQEAREELEPSLDQQSNTSIQPLIQHMNIGGMAVSLDVEAGIQRARSGGQPLADSIREPMEQVFGADFSGVRVHTDAQADQLNQSIQAKAFTTGQDVFFRQGEYEPGSQGGQELLAHELTHVVQQGRGKVECLKKSPLEEVEAVTDTKSHANNKEAPDKNKELSIQRCDGGQVLRGYVQRYIPYRSVQMGIGIINNPEFPFRRLRITATIYQRHLDYLQSTNPHMISIERALEAVYNYRRALTLDITPPFVYSCTAKYKNDVQADIRLLDEWLHGVLTTISTG